MATAPRPAHGAAVDANTSTDPLESLPDDALHRLRVFILGALNRLEAEEHDAVVRAFAAAHDSALDTHLVDVLRLDEG